MLSCGFHCQIMRVCLGREAPQIPEPLAIDRKELNSRARDGAPKCQGDRDDLASAPPARVEAVMPIKVL